MQTLQESLARMNALKKHFRDVGSTLQAGQVYVYKLGN